MSLRQDQPSLALTPARFLIALTILAACHEDVPRERDAGDSHEDASSMEDGSSGEGDAGATRDAGGSSDAADARSASDGATSTAPDAGAQVQVNPATRATLSVRDPLQVCLLDAQG